MEDIFLIVLVVFVIVGALAANVRLLIYYQMPEDSDFSSSILVKTIIVMSMTLAWMIVLLLPVDVRNSRPVPGFLDMEMIWSASFITLAVFLIIIVPGAIFYHEVEGDDTVKRKRGYVCCNLCMLIFFSAAVVAISFPFLATAALPVVEYDCQAWQDAAAVPDVSQTCASGKNAEVSFKVSFDVYLMAALSFVGWFFFAMFGGIGLSAAPLEMILAFVDRPRAIDEVTYRQRRKIVGQAAAILLQRAEDLQQRDGDIQDAKSNAKQSRWRGSGTGGARKVKTEYNRFKRDSHLLEEEYDRLVISKFGKGESIVVSVAKLLIGILFTILSLAWVFHIILYVLISQLSGGTTSILFLNELFAAFESTGVYPLGVAFFALFNLYLLYCVVKGCLKFGMRIVFFFSIHPMRARNTPLNSILFNVEMVLLSSAAVVQLSQTCFADYARLTQSDVIFSTQIKHLSFYRYFFENNVFVIIILSLFLLGTIYLLVRPREGGSMKFDKKADKQLAQIVGAAATPKPAASV
ncbi:unnamed protein product [Polarella glacialis]|uniref:Uncharacterized protein n=1 Tax=Polarella glacialis TaxID=89957 RepID=A0A813DFU5_POLGL|nr:unnamed protein product [Polarella glacialis]